MHTRETVRRALDRLDSNVVDLDRERARRDERHAVARIYPDSTRVVRQFPVGGRRWSSPSGTDAA